ncbi:MAG: transposase [Anaerolineae bacterium]
MTPHHRRSIRLQGYDYTQHGAYFVTICAHERRCIWGQVAGGAMVLNEWGRVVQSCWDEIPVHYPMVELDVFVTMPNHVHGVIVITRDDESNGGGMIYHAPTKREFSKPIANSLSTIIGTFKAAVTRRIHRLPNAPDHPIWQRNYYEHIIRSEDALNMIRAYVVNNPAKWAEDQLFVEL